MQIHGSIPYAELAELGLKPADIVDFSANVDPYPLPVDLEALRLWEDLAHYPDAEGRAITEALHRTLGYAQETILLSAGSTELIYALPRLWPRAALLGPTYGDYAAAYGRQGLQCRMLEWQNLDQQPSQETLRHCDLLLVCNPNNPTGHYLDPERLRALARAMAPGLLVVDEAYQELGVDCHSAADLVHSESNVLILKSLTKPYALAGLRCGYALAHPELAARLRPQLLPWGIPITAQRLVPALLEAQAVFEAHWQQLRDDRAALIQGLETMGFVIESRQAPFFLCQVGDAEACRQYALRHHKVALRSCASFGRPEWIRIMPNRSEHNDRLVQALDDWRRYAAMC